MGLTLLGSPAAGGGMSRAGPTDVLLGSILQSHPSTALTLNAAATNLLLQVAGSTILTVGASGASAASLTGTTSITTPLLTSAGALALNAATATSVTLGVNGGTTLTVSAAGMTAAAPIAMGGNGMTGLPIAAATGDALAFPWITSSPTTAYLSASSHIISSPNGTSEYIGLTLTLAAGTYELVAQLRTNVQASTPGFIVATLRNTSDSTTFANSERMCVVAQVANQPAQSTTTALWTITLTGTKTIDVQMETVGGAGYFSTGAFNDANGRTLITATKVGT